LAIADSLGKFYGGENGLRQGLALCPIDRHHTFPGDPDMRIGKLTALVLYDIGYAKDLTAQAAKLMDCGPE